MAELGVTGPPQACHGKQGVAVADLATVALGEIRVGTVMQARRPSSESHFFVSYCREDIKYVERLTAHLQGFGLPLWLDRYMEWGVQRFPEEIRQRLTGALAVIVIMSPDSVVSRWVEIEVLEGQRYDRDFFPILLAGERFFLLASTKFFDARDGSLPSEREIRQLQRIHDAHVNGTGQAPPVVLPSGPVQRPIVRTIHLPADDSIRKLRSYLAEGEIAHADILTTSILLKAVGRLDDGWMRKVDGKRVPFDLLASIDAAWSSFSQAQGFGAQLALHDSPPGSTPAGSYRDFALLELALGWKKAWRDFTPRYGEFVKPSEYPTGFFPTLRNPQLERFDRWHDPWQNTVMAVHLQLRRWAGQA